MLEQSRSRDRHLQQLGLLMGEVDKTLQEIKKELPDDS